MKKQTNKNIEVENVYFSVVAFSQRTERLNPYDGYDEDKIMCTLLHKAKSEEDATRKAKIHYAKELFSDEDNEIFMCSSFKITIKDVDDILNA